MAVFQVYDNPYWVSGLIAKESRKYTETKNILHCNMECFKYLRGKGLVKDKYIDVIHYFTPHIPELTGGLLENIPAIINIFHLEEKLYEEYKKQNFHIMYMSNEWKKILELYNFDPKKLYRISCGVDVTTFFPVKDTTKIRKKYLIEKETRVIGYSGAYSSNSGNRKNLSLLVDVIKKYGLIHDDVIFIINGPGWKENLDLPKNIKDKVKYFEYQIEHSSLVDFYNLCDVHLVTSNIEGGPMTLLEASACGVPSVSTKVGFALENFSDKNSIIYAEKGSINSFIDGLDYLFQDNKYLEIGQNARDIVVKNNKWSMNQKDLQNLYQKFTHKESRCFNKYLYLFYIRYISTAHNFYSLSKFLKGNKQSSYILYGILSLIYPRKIFIKSIISGAT